MFNDITAMLAVHGFHASRDVVKRAVKRDLYVNEDEKIDFPLWGLVLMVFTIIGFGVLFASIEYTLKNVVTTLAFVETPTAAVTVTPASDEEDADAPLDKQQKERLLKDDQETVTLVPAKPITSKIRTTIRHITSQAGRTARWRGLIPWMAYSFTYGFVYKILNGGNLRYTPGLSLFAALISSIATSNLHMAFTQAVIASPSSKPWYKRVGGRKELVALVIPAIIRSWGQYFAFGMSVGVTVLLGCGFWNSLDLSSEMPAPTAWTWAIAPLSLITAVATTYVMIAYVALPATAVQFRVEASLLPEDDESIIPLDRTYNGIVVPAIVGGTGYLSYRDAWKSFDNEARRRTFILYAKIFVSLTALAFLFVHVLFFQAWIIIGTEQLGKIAATVRKGN